MNQNFENRDFEHFLKQNADQYKMFPSEKVWKGINNTLHTRRRWYGIGLALLLLTTAAVTGIMLSPSNKQPQTLSEKSNVVSTKSDKPLSTKSEVIIIPKIAKNKINISAISPDNTQKILFSTPTPAEESTVKNNLARSSTILAENEKPEASEEAEIALLTKPIATARQPIKSEATYNIKKKEAIPIVSIDKPAINNSTFETTVTDSHIEETESTPAENSLNQSKDIYPMTIESVVNAYKNNKLSKKVVWQLHITPSITYRKLGENRPFLDATRSSLVNTPVYTIADINSVVTHKPDIGIQLGVSAGIPVSKIMTLTAGLQFNVSKYNIQASNYSNEIATIALSNSSGGTNTVSTVTNLRNVGGYRASWLHNKYISASLPVGAEFKLSGSRKTIIGVGATIQPTYILGNRAYLLSTDLKNYARFPSLTRKWNVNTGFELFAGYSTGKIDWRIGPHARYQLLSSFNGAYPIREHLFDFGVKLGITLK